MSVQRKKNPNQKILFCAKDPRCYTYLANYDGTDLSPIRWECGFQIALVDKFKYLGSCLSRNCRDNFDIDNKILARLLAASVNAFSPPATFQNQPKVLYIYQSSFLSFSMAVNVGH